MPIVAMEPWHILCVVMQMREQDAVDFDLLAADADRQRWACARALAPGLAYAVLNSEGRPVACFGFLDDGPARCTAWLVATRSWCCHVKSIAKAFKIVAREGGYRRIQAHVRPGRPGAEKFLKWLGFNRDAPLPKMCADGGPMDLYSLCPSND
jgi:hypothetical protein